MIETVYKPLTYPTKAQAEAWVNEVPARERKFVEYFTHTFTSYLFYYDDYRTRKWKKEHVLLLLNKFYIAWHRHGIRIGFTNGAR